MAREGSKSGYIRSFSQDDGISGVVQTPTTKPTHPDSIHYLGVDLGSHAFPTLVRPTKNWTLSNLDTVSKKNVYLSKFLLLIKNPQFLPNQADIQTILPTHDELVIFAKFHNFWSEIV